MSELFNKARRFNALLTEHQIRVMLKQPVDEAAYVEICSLYLQVRDGLGKFKAVSA